MTRPPASDRRRLLRLLPAVLLVALLCAPGVAWLAGARQPLLESRAKEEFPAFNRSSVRDEHTFRRIDRALLDRFPGRREALDAHARIAIDLFRDSPSPAIALGGDDYLYYLLDLSPCQEGGRPSSDPADAADVLARTLVASGRNTGVAITGSKLFLHDEDAPGVDDEEAARCAEELERRIDARLAEAPGGLALDERLRELERRGTSTFLRKDSHWNWQGRRVFIEAVLERIRPGLAEEVGLFLSPEYDRPGDLLPMIGRSGTERDRTVGVRRSPRSPPKAGEVMLLGDSQMHFALRAPFWPGLDGIMDVVMPGSFWCDWTAVEGRGCDEALLRARTVIVQSVARTSRVMTMVCYRPVELLGELLRPTATARWEPVDGSEQPDARSLVLPASGAVTVRVRVPGADVSDTPRLLRLPVEQLPTAPDGAAVPVTMNQEPQAGPAAPCATLSQGEAGRSLFLPVPAGRRASDLVVSLHGAPGTRLGTPAVIPLDGRRRVAARR